MVQGSNKTNTYGGILLTTAFKTSLTPVPNLAEIYKIKIQSNYVHVWLSQSSF